MKPPPEYGYSTRVRNRSSRLKPTQSIPPRPARDARMVEMTEMSENHTAARRRPRLKRKPLINDKGDAIICPHQAQFRRQAAISISLAWPATFRQLQNRESPPQKTRFPQTILIPPRKILSALRASRLPGRLIRQYQTRVIHQRALSRHAGAHRRKVPKVDKLRDSSPLRRAAFSRPSVNLRRFLLPINNGIAISSAVKSGRR